MPPIRAKVSTPAPHGYNTRSRRRVSQMARPSVCSGRQTIAATDESQVSDKDGHFIVKLGATVGNYKIDALLGGGTYGKVVLSGTRAIKIIKDVEKYRDAARNEVRILEYIQSLRHNVPIIAYHGSFDHHGHVAMVFPALEMSLYDFMKTRKFAPFRMNDIEDIAIQLLRALDFLHSESIIHTDLKPGSFIPFYTNHKENIMLINSSSRQWSEIRLIDFGSAVVASRHHRNIVSTRHYRAPEVVLGMNWSTEIDIWSLGCLLVELFTGIVLFQTHDDLEHLALMTRIVARIPTSTYYASSERVKALFKSPALLNYPSRDTLKSSIEHVNKAKSLDDIIGTNSSINRIFLDFIRRMLQIDPLKRKTAESLLHHLFLTAASS